MKRFFDFVPLKVRPISPFTQNHIKMQIFKIRYVTNTFSHSSCTFNSTYNNNDCYVYKQLKKNVNKQTTKNNLKITSAVYSRRSSRSNVQGGFISHLNNGKYSGRIFYPSLQIGNVKSFHKICKVLTLVSNIERIFFYILFLLFF